ncbi:hypothetical protein SVAN01_06391 [Stagonosporopsis vannaccii]|nr:hypothetical protein SVAN01_06391 [Stagonosporopsis vannaccii]
MRDGPLGSRSLGRAGRAGRPGGALSHQGSSAAGGLFKTAPARPCTVAAQAALCRRWLLLVQLRVPEQRQPEAAGSTCWCFWEPPAH